MTFYQIARPARAEGEVMEEVEKPRIYLNTSLCSRHSGLLSEIALMGSGKSAAFEAGGCVVDQAKKHLAFAKAESCGRCLLCREGTAQMLAILTDISEGKGRVEDVELLLELGEGIEKGGICDLSRMASSLVLAMIADFRGDIEAHIRKKRCPALVCRKFITFHILADRCTGCGKCLDRCPENAIAGGKMMIHVIAQDDCTQCGVCTEACPPEYGAVTKAGTLKPKTPKKPVPVGTWTKP